MAKSELATTKRPNFELAIASADSTPAELVETLQETLGGRLRPYDLQRIVWPSGKATSFEIPTLSGDTEPVKELVAIPVLVQTTRLFWGSKNTAEGTQPDCKSDDGINGLPTERGRQLGATGACEACPLGQWGPNNTPPACKERRDLFLLLEGQFFPMVLSVPPSSIKIWRDYIKPLSLQGIPFWGSITKFKLTTAQNANGDPFAQLKCEFVGRVSPEEKERLSEYRKVLAATFKAGLEATRQESREIADQPPVEVKRPVFDELGNEMPLEE